MSAVPEDVVTLVDQAWQDLVEKDDRTSPEDYPDHALITHDELAGYMRLVARLSVPPVPDAHEEAKEIGHALAWALAEIRGETRYENDGQKDACLEQAEKAFAELTAQDDHAWEASAKVAERFGEWLSAEYEKNGHHPQYGEGGTLRHWCAEIAKAIRAERQRLRAETEASR